MSANHESIKRVSIHDLIILQKAPPAGNQASFREKRKTKHNFNNDLSYSIKNKVVYCQMTEMQQKVDAGT